jgi:hypothetical protein
MNSRSVFDQLVEQPVPERPHEFRRLLHERINARLTLVHLLEFAVQVLPFAFYHFCSALGGAVMFSITGRYPEKGDNHAERSDEVG